MKTAIPAVDDIYSEGVSPDSPGLPRIAATLGHWNNNPRTPSGFCPLPCASSIPDIPFVVINFTTFQELAKFRFEICLLMVQFLFADVLDDSP